MEQQIKVLKSTELCGHQFNVYGSSEEPYFFAKDVANVISLTNVSDMVSRLDEDERYKFNLGRQGNGWFLTEDGLYEVLMQSRKPIAKQFKKGVKAILKEIRKTGGYIATQQDDTPEMIMAKALQVAQQTIDNHKQRLQIAEAEKERYKEEVKVLEPKAKYTDEVLQSTSTFTLTQVAHDLGLRSVHAFTKILKEKRILYKQSGQWQPTAKYSTMGLFDTRTAKFVKSDDTIGTSVSTVITEKGRQYFHSLINQNRRA